MIHTTPILARSGRLFIRRDVPAPVPVRQRFLALSVCICLWSVIIVTAVGQ